MSAPTNQNAVLTGDQYKLGGGSVTITSAGNALWSVWLAPLGTTTFVPGPTITTAGGTATSILAPATDGIYHLFVMNDSLEYSAASTHIAVSDNISPTIAIGNPAPPITKNGPVNFLITYYDLNLYLVTLIAGNVTLNLTGSATGTKSVTGSGTTRTVKISAISGDGTIGISIATHTASDLAENFAPAAGPSVLITVSSSYVAPPTGGGNNASKLMAMRLI